MSLFFRTNMKEKIEEFTAKITSLGQVLRISERALRMADLERGTTAPEFWNDNQKARAVLKEIDIEKKWIDKYNAAEKALLDSKDFYQMLEDGGDDSEVRAELEKSITSLEKIIATIELMKMLGGEDDNCDTIFEIHSGAGGTEATDWANMLLRMYTRYFEDYGYEHHLVDLVPGDEGGVKSAVLEVKGEYAFGYLKAEIGVHRLVRISPFDSNARRHTSFVSVSAIPMVEDAVSVEVKDEDLRIDTYRSSGAGGQHVNKTESAVRMTHLPTGIVASCQTERSQIKNREICMKMLKAKLLQHYRAEEERKRDAKAAEKKKIEWGSQIRSYVLHPYNMVKDHRTEHETSNTTAVLDGDIHEFIRQYLLKH
ncbi:MAG: peptide chain release factor 2 [Fibrobacteres bacterium]|nr:peptide chain release factor 2 [Fibrobacterota bacterium]